MLMLPALARCSFFLVGWLAMAGAQAELVIEPGPPTPAEAAKASSQERHEKAKAIYQGYPSGKSPFIILDADEEPGILSPRVGVPTQEERAFERRWQQRILKEHHPPKADDLPLGPVSPELQRARDMKERLQSRGRSSVYTGTGNWQDLDLSQRDKDGLPLVYCHNTDNVSGRIGDGSTSGSVVILNRNGQQIKVRCR